MLLTPEKSTEIQNSIGADIIMQLDDVVSSTTTGNRTRLKHDPSLTYNNFYCGLQFKQTFCILYKGEYSMLHLGLSGQSVGWIDFFFKTSTVVGKKVLWLVTCIWHYKLFTVSLIG